MANKNIMKHITLYSKTSYDNTQTIIDGIKKHGADGIELQFAEIPSAIPAPEGILVGSLTTEKHELFDLACSENHQRSESIKFFHELLEFASKYPTSPNSDQEKPIVAIRSHIENYLDAPKVQSYEQAMNNLYFALEDCTSTGIPRSSSSIRRKPAPSSLSPSLGPTSMMASSGSNP